MCFRRWALIGPDPLGVPFPSLMIGWGMAPEAVGIPLGAFVNEVYQGIAILICLRIFFRLLFALEGHS